MYHRAFVVDKPSVKMVKDLKFLQEGLCYVALFRSKMKNLNVKGFAIMVLEAHAWAISRGTIIETTPIKETHMELRLTAKTLNAMLRMMRKQNLRNF